MVCNNIPALYHKPGHSDCVSKVALNMALKEIHETFKWDSDLKSTSKATRLDENTFVIATKEDSSILMDCESREGIDFLKLHKGNNILHAESNCLIRAEGISPDFLFRTPEDDPSLVPASDLAPTPAQLEFSTKEL